MIKLEERKEPNFSDSLLSHPSFSGTLQSIMDLVQENTTIEIGNEDTSGALVWTPTHDILANGLWVRLTIPRPALITLSRLLGTSSPSSSSASEDLEPTT